MDYLSTKNKVHISEILTTCDTYQDFSIIYTSIFSVQNEILENRGKVINLLPDNINDFIVLKWKVKRGFTFYGKKDFHEKLFIAKTI